MLRAKARRPLNHKWRKNLPFLIITAVVTFIVFLLLCHAEVRAVIPFVSDLIDSGKSLFIPSIPDVNVFAYMPAELHMRLSLGTLVDLSIITFIVSSLFYFGYPYYKALRGIDSLQFVYLNKTGSLTNGPLESPLSKSFLVGSDQLALVDFEYYLDQEQYREAKAQRLQGASSRQEHQEKARASEPEHGRRKRNSFSHGKYLDICKSAVQFSFFCIKCLQEIVESCLVLVSSFTSRNNHVTIIGNIFFSRKFK